MRCEDAQRLIPDMMAGELSFRERLSLKGHLWRCPSCRRQYEGMKGLWRELKALSPKAPPWGEIDEWLKERIKPPMFPSFPLPWRWAVPAAIALAALLMVVTLPQRMKVVKVSGGVKEESAYSLTSFSREEGEEIEETLLDLYGEYGRVEGMGIWEELISEWETETA